MKNAEEMLERYSNGLAAVNKELEAFSYSVSHDLRNPLNSIMANIAIVKNDGHARLTPDARRAFDYIAASAQRMSGVISDLMVLSNISRSTLTYRIVGLAEIALCFSKELSGSQPPFSKTIQRFGNRTEHRQTDC